MNAEEHITLKNYAINMIQKVVNRTPAEITPPRGDIFQEERGAFVTLKKNGQLRGCIGLIVSDKPLWEVIGDMAQSAAIHDPRFAPVSREELDDIEVEISILTPLSLVEDVNDIQIGVDGLLLRRGVYSGVFLPQVPVEWNWDLDDYLDNLCLKAGLPPKSHLSPRAELFKFQAEVF